MCQMKKNPGPGSSKFVKISKLYYRPDDMRDLSPLFAVQICSVGLLACVDTSALIQTSVILCLQFDHIKRPLCNIKRASTPLDFSARCIKWQKA